MAEPMSGYKAGYMSMSAHRRGEFHVVRVDQERAPASFCCLLAERPFCKITVADIAGGCGLSRMTFYYHFEDVYDLLAWTCGERASAACEGLEWQEGLLRLFRTVRRDRDLVMNVYRSVDRSVLEAALFPFAHDLILREMGARVGAGVASPADREFVVAFFEYAFAGTLLTWIGNGMGEDPREIVDRLGVIMSGQAVLLADRFHAS